MSHNLVQKRGRYPKTKQENNLAQGGWQAQTLSVPSQSQGFSDVDYGYQNQNQTLDTQHTQSYANQWTDHQQTVMHEEPQQKPDPNGHGVQQDVWNDWNDQGWENWNNNNGQPQSQHNQNYYSHQQYQQAQAQQSVQYMTYDQSYLNQQERQQQPLLNHGNYENHSQPVDQNLTYPASCSTPHHQYSDESSLPPFSPNSQLEGPIQENQTEAERVYSPHTPTAAGLPTAEQRVSEMHPQDQIQQYSYDASLPQQQNYNPMQQQQQQQQQQQSLPLQTYNILSYDQSPQPHENVPPQQFSEYHQPYGSVEQDGNISERDQLHSRVPESPAPSETRDQESSQGGFNLQPVVHEPNSGSGGGDGLTEEGNGNGEFSLHVKGDEQNPPLTLQEHREEPISDSWDTLEDNMECLSIHDQPSSHQSQPDEMQNRGPPSGERSEGEYQQQQQLQQNTDPHKNESDLQLPPPQAHFRQEKPAPQQQQIELEAQHVNVEEPQPVIPTPQHAPPPQCVNEAAQLPGVSGLPTLSEVLQAKNLKSDAAAAAAAAADAEDDSECIEGETPVCHEPLLGVSSCSIESDQESRNIGSDLSARSGRRNSSDIGFDLSPPERTTYMADIVRPASEGAPAGEASSGPMSFPLPSSTPVLRPSTMYAEDSQNESNYEPIAAREVVGQRASAERNAPTGLDLKASSVRQSPLGGEGGSVAPPPAVPRAPTESSGHAANSESYRSGSQDERARSRRSARSSSSEDSEVAEHNREMMHQKMREREYELPAGSKRDQKWKSSRSKLREHDYHSDESEVRKHRRRGNRDSEDERVRRKYASDRDYEEDDPYDDRRHRRRNDRKRDSDETEYSEYASDRRRKYGAGDDTDSVTRSRRRSDEARRPRNRKYADDSDFDVRRSGRRVPDRKRRDERQDYFYGRPPSRESSLNGSFVTSQISDSEVSMYDHRRTRHTTFDRHPALGTQGYDPRNFQASAHGIPMMGSSLHPRQSQTVRSHPQQSQISMGMIPHELRGQDLQVVRHAYETDPDYRDVLDDYFVQCAAQGFDISQVRSFVCGGSTLQQSSVMAPTDLDESLTSSFAFGGVSTRIDDPAPPEELRKHMRPHAIARFTSLNSFVKLHPSHRSLDLKPPVVEIHDLKLLLEDDPESKSLAKFPGPLVRADTHKNQVIHFCNQKINAIRKSKPYVDHIVDRESYILLWELLVLLLRQNGHVTGTDIAELLLKDAPYVDPASVQKLAEQEMSQIEESDQGSSDDSQTTVDGTRLNRAAKQVRRQGLSQDQALSKFRELLLFGHRKEAIEHAIRYELWGHAFCLSSKMDMKLYTYVHSKFYQSFAGNDPLQTVYQLYSGRQPTSVTCVGDVTWGDWRPHLAMILANPSVRPEIDARSIVTMGDILFSKGCLCAAHFCYLMAQVDFGEFQDKRCKLVLLASNHTQNFVDFATTEAIECTEIYEYAQSLSNPGYTLPTLGLYKYLHAKRLVDQGFVQEGLHYCERLAIDIFRNVDAYKPELVHEVYALASRLRYNDAHYSHDAGNYDELGDPQWLTNLGSVEEALRSGQPIDRSLESRRSSDFDGANIKQEPQYSQSPSPQQAQQQLLQLQPQPVQHIPQQDVQPAPLQQQFHQPQRYIHDGYQQQREEHLQNQQQLQSPYYNHLNELPPHGELKEEEPPQPASMPEYSNEPYPQRSSVEELHQPPVAQAVIAEQQSPYPKPHIYGQRQSVASISSSITSASTVDSIQRPAPMMQNEATSYQQKPTISAKVKPETISPEASPSTGKKTGPTSRAGSSWLNGIFKSFLPKGPNQMILPDDKDQSIVWDPEKKIWVDQNADPAAQEASFAPPPSDLSLGAAAAPPIPLMSAPPVVPVESSPDSTVPPQAANNNPLASTSPSVSNRFHRIANRPRYVDVFKQNNSTSPAAQPMPPIVPEGNVSQFMIPPAQPQFFVPTPSAGAQDQPFDLNTNRVDYEEQRPSQESDKVPGT